MASTYSTNLALELMGTGDQSGTWGTTTNTNLGTLIEQAIAGYTTQALTGAGPTALTIPNGTTGVGRYYVIEFTGTPTAGHTVTVPAVQKPYIFYNNTNIAITVKVSGQTGVTIAVGKKAIVYTNGTDVIEVANAPVTEAGTQTLTNKTLASPLITGTLTVPTINAGSGTALSLQSNSTTGLYIDTSQNVGIGTSSPSKKFVISNAGAVGMEWSPTDYTNNMRQFAYNRSTSAYVALRTEASQHEWYIGGTEAARIDSSGNVGIGLTNPSVKLQLYNASSDTSTYITSGSVTTSVTSSNTNANGQIGTTTSNPLLFLTGGSERMRIDSSGKVGINVTPSASTDAKLQVTGGTTNASSLATAYSTAAVAFVPKSTSGYSLAIASGTGDFPQLQVSANGTAAGDLLVQPYGGNVGIGTSSPGAKLSVVSSTNNGIAVFDGTVNTILYNSSSNIGVVGTSTNHPMVFTVNNSERMRIDTSGNLRLNQGGTIPATNPSYNFVCGNDISGGAYLIGINNSYLGRQSSDGSTILNTGQANIIFSRGNYGTTTESMRIDSSGNVGIGTTTTAINDQVAANRPFVVASSDAVTTVGGFSPSLNIVNLNTTTNNGAQLNFASTYTSGGINTSSAYVGAIFGARTNTTNYYAAGTLVFGTAIGAANNGPQERMRIDSSGNLLVGTTTQANNAKVTVLSNDSIVGGVAVASSASLYRQMYLSNTGTILQFWNGSNQANLSAAGAWTNASDARLKKDIVDIKYGLDTVLKSQPRSFNRVDVEGEFIGFIAQELKQVIPEVVFGSDEEGDQYTVDYASMVAVAFKAIQELKAEIDTLKGTK
jgi:hypothetical protein